MPNITTNLAAQKALATLNERTWFITCYTIEDNNNIYYQYHI